jgi:hypothetical protein
MERKMLLGIKRRAEGLAREQRARSFLGAPSGHIVVASLSSSV